MKKIYISIFILLLVFLTCTVKAQAPPELLHYNFNNTGTLVPNFASTPPTGATNGTITQNLTQGVSTGQCGMALSGTGTSGSTDYINTSWTGSVSGSWSIAFWTNSITPSSTLWYIFGESGSGFRCFTNGVAAANNWILRGTGLTDMLITNGAVVTAAHNCFVFDAPNNQGRMYLNGVLQGTVAQTGSTVFSWSAPFKVGGYGSGSNLSGLMDEFRFYARALTNTEVSQIAQGSPANTTMSITSCGPYTSPTTNSVYTNSGVYTETFVSCGGTSTNNINLTVQSAPTLSIIASNTNICSGITVSMSASGSATSYTWNGTGPNTSTFNATPATTSIYTLVGNAGGSCNVTRTISINVTATPTLGVINTGLNICQGGSVTFTASGAGSYSWSTGAQTNTLMQTPTNNTTYIVYAANGTCSTSSSYSVLVFPNPTVNVSSLSPTICQGAVLTLTANGANTFVWSNSATGATTAVSPLTNTVYTVIGISNNCSDTKTINVTVNASPTISINSSTTTVCSGSVVTFTANGASSYLWTGGSTANPFTVAPTANTTYTVAGSNGTCSSTASVAISILIPPPVNIISSSTMVCSGQIVSLVGTGALTYTWSNNVIGSAISVTPSANTSYTLYGKGNGPCMGAKDVNIVVNQNPTVTATTSKPTICKGETAIITASGAGTYAWSTTASTNTISVKPNSTTNYTVVGTDANGCTATYVITQTVNTCQGITALSSNESGIRTYPNPGSGLFNLEVPEKLNGTSIQVFSASGQLVLEKKLESNIEKIDLSGKARGLYYLKVQGTSETIKLFVE